MIKKQVLEFFLILGWLQNVNFDARYVYWIDPLFEFTGMENWRETEIKE